MWVVVLLASLGNVSGTCMWKSMNVADLTKVQFILSATPFNCGKYAKVILWITSSL